MVEIRRLVPVAAAALALVASPGAFAASPMSSCMGQEASSLSPPGSSDEAPGGMKDFAAFAKENLSPPGTLFTTFAHLHEGSHAACDEAVEG
jgi:hypothetical protein